MGFFNQDHKNLIFVPAVDPLLAVKKTPADPYYHRTHNNAVNNTLAHAIRSFEEKNSYPPVPVGGGHLPIKANGAIVMHRPKPQDDESDYDDDDEEDDDDDDNEKKERQEEGYSLTTSASTTTSTTTTTTTTAESSIFDNTGAYNAMHLVHEENRRLRQQLLIDRQQNEKYRLAKEQYEHELVVSKQRIKKLERTADRFQKLLSTDLITDQKKSKRRQSTGTCFRDIPLTSVPPSTTMTVSYEHKIQILLNELEAMELDEMESTKSRTLQKMECDTLMRKLKLKEDIIQQLTYDLQIEKSLH